MTTQPTDNMDWLDDVLDKEGYCYEHTNCDENECIGKIINQRVKAAIAAKFKEAEKRAALEARIDALSEFKVPEQYEHFSKLMGSEACSVCGFNATKAKEYVDNHIRELEKQLSQSEGK